MSFESFQLNLKLTNIGYNKVMALDGKPISLKFIALGKGNIAGTAGYSVDFRDTKTALLHEVVRKQIDSSKKTSYTDDNGTPLARLDFNAIFSDNSSFDVWEMGFFDDVGDLIYIWSHPTDVFAPKRPNIHLVISVSQHLLFAEEASGVIVQDAGLPFELFLQPLKDDISTELRKYASRAELDEIINNGYGKTAYEIWIDAGNTGTTDDFLLSLKGAPDSVKSVPVDGMLSSGQYFISSLSVVTMPVNPSDGDIVELIPIGDLASIPASIVFNHSVKTANGAILPSGTHSYNSASNRKFVFHGDTWL